MKTFRRYAWITLATNDPYCLGALVLAHSLKRVGTKYDIAILITPGVTSTMREKLNAVFSVVKEVNVLDSKDEANLALLARPELGITFTKLHCWRMTQYEKCVFIDADALVVRNCDELFEREELSAAPDVGWPDCFNSGVFVFKPSQQTFASLTSFAASKGSFDGGDQGLLNQYFSDWAHKDISKHLPFIYNMCSTATYSYLPAYKQYGNDVRIIHFIGNAKPWLQYFDTQTGQVHPSSESAHLQSLLQLWWNIFCQMVHPELSPVMARSTLAPIWHDSCPRESSTACTLYNSPDSTYNKVDETLPDFSIFHDPWENYIEIKNENNDIIDKNINDTDSINNKKNEFHSNYDETYRLNNVTDLIDERQNDYNYCSNSKLNDIHEPSEHFENVNITESQDEIYHLEECSNLKDLEDHSDHYHFPHQLSANDSNEYTTHTNYQCENSLNNNDGNLTEDENHRNCQNNIPYTDTHTINSHTHSQTSTESEFIACQSQTNSFNETPHDNTGIAGALAKITLGSARSPEQEAFEEHLRKHSWEQGKIDYMGRDSFENIWTKICTTISTVTEHEPTAPQKKLIEEDNESKTSQVTATTITKIQSTETEAALPTVLQHQDVVSEIRPRETSEETTEIKSPCCESQKSMIERPNIIHPSVESPPISETTATVPISLDAMQVNLEQILASTCSPSKLDTESSKNDKCSTMKDDVATASCHTEKNTIISQSSAIPPQCPLKITPESLTLTDTQLTEIASKESHVIEETQCAKNITDTAVPIQVAESVLEADIKESVSEDVKPVTEEAISSMSAPIQESISTVVETPLEPPAPAHSQSVAALPPAQANGTDRSDYDSESNENIKPEVTPIPSAVVEPVYAPVSVPEPEIKQLEEDKSDIIEIAPEVGKTDNVQTVERATTSREITTESSITDTVQPTQSSPTAAPMKETIIKDIESKTNVPDEISTQVVLEDLSKKTEEQHEKPMPITQLNIPGTPTIIEATPPTSPPLDAVVTPLEEGTKPTKKVVKKSIKKSSPDEKAEGTETEESKKSKKTTKKSPSVIKKSKESLEEGADSSAVEKPKKIVKVKKTTKPTQNLEADTSVPDTPPPTTSSETPVPPKRKVKPGTAKPSGTSTNKSE
ncbi:hypothetical protein PV325_006307 [Microctonus aethiopoides]|nr:hypothetical protein PV325_006307 [Microctonus aethiopoides]